VVFGEYVILLIIKEMYKWFKILWVIPARWWSKWIPKKNIKELNWKHLIWYTIETWLKSDYIDDLYVTSDSEDILKISIKYWANVILRPASLSWDKAKTKDAIKHIVNSIEKKYDIIVLLQPTSPFRTVNSINKAILMFIDNFDFFDSLMPLSESKWKSWIISNWFYLPNLKNEIPRQDLKTKYDECWTIFIYKVANLNKENIIWKRILPFIVSDKIEAIDIDTMSDFYIAESILRNNNTNYGK
jgi:CMP-N-acetylneuraminic acid synthetase